MYLQEETVIQEDVVPEERHNHESKEQCTSKIHKLDRGEALAPIPRPENPKVKEESTRLGTEGYPDITRFQLGKRYVPWHPPALLYFQRRTRYPRGHSGWREKHLISGRLMR